MRAPPTILSEAVAATTRTATVRRRPLSGAATVQKKEPLQQEQQPKQEEAAADSCQGPLKALGNLGILRFFLFLICEVFFGFLIKY